MRNMFQVCHWSSYQHCLPRKKTKSTKAASRKDKKEKKDKKNKKAEKKKDKKKGSTSDSDEGEEIPQHFGIIFVLATHGPAGSTRKVGAHLPVHHLH